jgi:Protein of unknown function (DUF4232)
MRVPTTVAAVAMLGLLTALTACSGGSLSAQTVVHPSSPSATTAAPSPTTFTTAPIPRTTAPQTTAPPPATTASFTAELDVQRQDVGMIMLTNTSGHTVTVRGWSTLAFSNAHGDTLAVPTQKVEIPGPGPSITVVSGGSVFAPVQWTDGDKADDSTFVADTVEVIPPGAQQPVSTKFVGVDGTSPGYYELDIKSVKIGTLQPSTHNLLAF